MSCRRPCNRADARWITLLPSYAGRNVKRDVLGFREPVPEAEKGANIPAFIPALLDLVDACIREAERVFVGSNEVDHRVGCFHQDVFPFSLFMFEPPPSLKDANYVTELRRPRVVKTRRERSFVPKQPSYSGCGLKRA